ncbi:MAG: hypothetical protein JRI68_31655, partial [Deltaproteobacteria bacterium]|nr:hypothetical protein [Deltaproteobacteria bacterium]
LLDQPTAAYLEQEGFSVAVSYDGCQASQDAHRRLANGSSSHSATLAGLRIALAELESVECCAVIAPDTVAGLASSLDDLLALGVPLVTFTPDWEASWSEAQLVAFDLALDDFADRWLASYRSGHCMDVEPFDSKIRSHIGGGFPLRSRCPFGLGELAVAPSGRLYPCDRLVRQDDGGDLCVGQAATGVDHAKVSALRACLAAPDTECATCELQGRCMHWCGCVNVMTSGAVGTPSPTVCQLEQRIIGTADRVAATLYDEQNAAFLAKFYP